MLDSNTSGMIIYHREVIGLAKFTVSVPDEVIGIVEKLMIEWETTRSGVITKLLKWHEKQRVAELMAEGYKVLADENRREIEEYLPAQAEVVLRDL